MTCLGVSESWGQSGQQQGSVSGWVARTGDTFKWAWVERWWEGRAG